MHRLVLLAWLALVALPVVHAADSAPRVFTVGVVPQFEARKLHAVWRPILDHLEKVTGHRFELRGSPTIPEFEKGFLAGQFDFAYMNPYHLVMANAAAGYTPLARDHGRQLYGVLVVRADSPIRDVRELAGKAVAFPSPNALGASLQMRQELHDLFGVDPQARYVKTHDAVYLNVLLGETTAGGGVQKTLNRQKPQVREALRVIHTTTKVAPHPLAVLPSVPRQVRQAVLDALLELGGDEAGRKRLAGIPMKRIGPASMNDYEPLKRMGLERFFVAPD